MTFKYLKTQEMFFSTRNSPLKKIRFFFVFHHNSFFQKQLIRFVNDLNLTVFAIRYRTLPFIFEYLRFVNRILPRLHSIILIAMSHRSKDVILTTVDCAECMEARVYTDYIWQLKWERNITKWLCDYCAVIQLYRNKDDRFADEVESKTKDQKVTTTSDYILNLNFKIFNSSILVS